jgi:hypothetical protein
MPSNNHSQCNGFLLRSLATSKIAAATIKPRKNDQVRTGWVVIKWLKTPANKNMAVKIPPKTASKNQPSICRQACTILSLKMRPKKIHHQLVRWL